MAVIPRKTKDGKTRYLARAYDPVLKKQVPCGTFDRRKDAVEAVNEYLSRPRAGKPKTVNQLREKWLAEWSVHEDWRASTLKHNRQQTKRFAAEHGHELADGLRKSDGLEWAVKHPTEVPALRALFGYGEFIDAVLVNPFAKLGGKKRNRGEITLGRGALTEPELDRLCEIATELHGGWHGAMIRFAALTCVREGELYELKFSDLGHDELTVSRSYSTSSSEVGPRKSGTPCTIVYPGKAREAVQGMTRRPGQHHVFVTPRDGNRFTAGSHGYYWRQARAAFIAELPEHHWIKERMRQMRGRKGQKGDLVWHELRHTGATLLLELGLSESDVAVQLGHADGGALVRKVYGHKSKAASRDRIKRALQPSPVRSIESVREQRGSA